MDSKSQNTWTASHIAQPASHLTQPASHIAHGQQVTEHKDSKSHSTASKSYNTASKSCNTSTTSQIPQSASHTTQPASHIKQPASNITHEKNYPAQPGWNCGFPVPCPPILQGAVALTVGSVPRKTVLELRNFHWLLKMNNQSDWRDSKTVLRGTDPIVGATAPGFLPLLPHSHPTPIRHLPPCIRHPSYPPAAALTSTNPVFQLGLFLRALRPTRTGLRPARFTRTPCRNLKKKKIEKKTIFFIFTKCNCCFCVFRQPM